jgi:transcription initiation factor IIE alpha subunit
MKVNTLLVKALKNVFDMSKEDAKALAKTVENVFNGEKEIEDMTVDKHVRSIFYELQKEKLLKLRREEYKEKGKFIRKYYWSFNNEIIKEEAQRKQCEEDPYKIYEKIPRSAWLLHSRSY